MSYRHEIIIEVLDPYDEDERLSPTVLITALQAAQEAIVEVLPTADITDMRVTSFRESELRDQVVNNIVGVVDAGEGS